MKYVLFSSSVTQRVTVEVFESSVLISKEWRKTPESEWKVGKGITIPKEYLSILGNDVMFSDYKTLEKFLEDNHFEVLKGE